MLKKPIIYAAQLPLVSGIPGVPWVRCNLKTYSCCHNLPLPSGASSPARQRFGLPRSGAMCPANFEVWRRPRAVQGTHPIHGSRDAQHLHCVFDLREDVLIFIGLQLCDNTSDPRRHQCSIPLQERRLSRLLQRSSSKSVASSARHCYHVPGLRRGLAVPSSIQVMRLSTVVVLV